MTDYRHLWIKNPKSKVQNEKCKMKNRKKKKEK